MDVREDGTLEKDSKAVLANSSRLHLGAAESAVLITLENFFRNAAYRCVGTRAGVMVKVPVPVQFAVAPVTDQVPVICPPLTVPSKVRIFASTPEDMMT